MALSARQVMLLPQIMYQFTELLPLLWDKGVIVRHWLGAGDGEHINNARFGCYCCLPETGLSVSSSYGSFGQGIGNIRNIGNIIGSPTIQYAVPNIALFGTYLSESNFILLSIISLNSEICS